MIENPVLQEQELVSAQAPAYQPAPMAQPVMQSAAQAVEEVGTFNYATYWSRVGAFFIDMVALGIVSTVLESVLAFVTNSTALSSLVGLIVGIAYYVYMDSSERQGTVGKIVLKIKIVDMNGQRITTKQAVLRYIGRIVSGLVFGIGYLWPLFDKKHQAWHDMIAKTLVVKSE